MAQQTDTDAIRREDAGSTGELEGLLTRMAGGDSGALAELYSRTRGAVYAAALAILQNADEAQDAAQDAFVRAWEAAGRYRPQGAPMAWLLTIARNEALMRLRRSGRQQTLSDQEWDAIPAGTAVSPEDRAVLQTALAGLSGDERQIVLLKAVSGLKHREIASLLHMPLPTVLSKYHRALKKLRDLLEGDEPHDGA